MHLMIVRKLCAGLAVGGMLAATPLATAAGPAATANRPYLGMAAEGVAPGAAPNGITVHSVTPESPAAKAGLKGNDRIVMADGKEVKTFEDFKKTLASHKPGDNVAIKVMRDGKEQTITVTLGEAPASNDKAQPSVQQSGPFLGVVTQALTARLKDNLGVTVDKGLVVTQVLPDSPAAKAGLADTDVITHFGDTAVSNPQELRDAVRKAGVDKEVSLTVVRGSKTMTLKARLQEASAGAAGLPGWNPRMPEGFEQFTPEGFENGQFRHFFSGMEKVPALEKKLQELENRVKELEKK